MTKKPMKTNVDYDLIFEKNKNSYKLGETINCSLKIWNRSKKKIRVFKYYIWFDWIKKAKSLAVSAEIFPGKSKQIKEKLSINIPKWVEPSHHFYNCRFDAEVKTDGDWEQGNWEQKTAPFSHKPDRLLINKCLSKHYNVFVSHRICEDDKTLVDKIKEIFENNGFDVFISEKDPQTNPSLWQEINEEIVSSNCFLLVWTKSAIAKPGELREELGKATLLKHYDSSSMPIFCMSESRKIPSSINDVNYTPIKRGSQMNDCIENILESIEIQYKAEKRTSRKRK